MIIILLYMSLNRIKRRSCKHGLGMPTMLYGMNAWLYTIDEHFPCLVKRNFSQVCNAFYAKELCYFLNVKLGQNILIDPKVSFIVL